MQNKFNRRQILTLAHLIKKSENITFGEAQKRAWKISRATQLHTLLKNNIVTFEYQKENGETRRAVGTLNDMFISYTPKGNGTTAQTINYTTAVKYWDLDANGFRCFRVDRLVKIVQIQSVNQMRLAA